MTLPEVLAQILFVLGAGFLVANILKAREILRWWRRRKTALLVWPGRKPPYYGLMLGIGMMLGVLILVKAYFLVPKASTVVTRVGGTETMTVDTFTISGSANRNVVAKEPFSFSVGGTLRVNANQAEGLYVGTFDVDLQYN